MLVENRLSSAWEEGEGFCIPALDGFMPTEVTLPMQKSPSPLLWPRLCQLQPAFPFLTYLGSFLLVIREMKVSQQLNSTHLTEPGDMLPLSNTNCVSIWLILNYLITKKKKKVWMLLMVDLMIIYNYFLNLNARLKIGCVVDVIGFS